MTGPGELLARALGPAAAVFAGDVVSVHDGDTFTVDVRLPITAYGADRPVGFGLAVRSRRVWLRAVVRLAGCNAAELGTPGGDAAAVNLQALLPAGCQVVLSDVRVDNYGGRWDAAVTLADGRDLVMMLIRDQWVAPWTGQGPKPTPPWPRPAARLPDSVAPPM